MKVLPKNDDVRRVLSHPIAGKFRAEGTSEWPDDSFTSRRLRDGDITVEEAKHKEVAEKDKPQSSRKFVKAE
jgi:hypothetical protein